MVILSQSYAFTTLGSSHHYLSVKIDSYRHTLNPLGCINKFMNIRTNTVRSHDDRLDIFRQVALYQNVSAIIAKNALLSFDSDISNRVITIPPLTIKDIQGQWVLVFSSLFGSGYLPIYEICDFINFSLVSNVNNIIPLGSVRGISEVVSTSPLLTMNITTTGYKLGFIDFQFSKSMLKTRLFTFLYSDNDILVSKSSSGGFSVLARVKSK